LIRQNDDTLAAWPATGSVLASVPAGKYSAVAVAGQHAVAIVHDGTLRTWGSDSAPYFVVSGLLNAPQGKFKRVAARTLYTLALRMDGTLYCWGQPPAPTLPGETWKFLNGWMATPVGPNIFYFPGETFEEIAAGNAHALALRADGTVMGWGTTLTAPWSR
jgi:alpha-tubulin suppressor-like RCC1 family protein